MKTVFRIFGVITVIIALLTCVAGIYRASIDKEKLAGQEAKVAEVEEKIAQFKEQVKDMTGESKAEMDQTIADAEKELKSLPSTSTYTILEFLYVVLLLLVLAFAVFLFRTNLKLTQQLLIAAIVLSLATYFISPDIKRGPYGGLESKTIALIAGIPAIISGLLAFLVAKKSAVKTN